MYKNVKNSVLNSAFHPTCFNHELWDNVQRERRHSAALRQSHVTLTLICRRNGWKLQEKNYQWEWEREKKTLPQPIIKSYVLFRTWAGHRESPVHLWLKKMKCLFHTIELFFINITHLSFTEFWEEVKNGHVNVASVLGAARSEIQRV